MGRRSSAGRLVGISTVYGVDGEHRTPYMTRAWVGRLRLHIFHRPDSDPDCHDHPWDFWTFPLTPYVEEVAKPANVEITLGKIATGEVKRQDIQYERTLDIVPAWRSSFRPAEHTHRVMGRLIRTSLGGWGYATNRPIVTLVWISKPKRPWGFLKSRDGLWCWIGWRDYVFNGGKHAPCEPENKP